NAAGGSRPMLRELQIRLPGVDRNLHGRIARGAPQFAAIEAHGIEPLRIFAGTSGVAVRKDMAADNAFDSAGMAAHVSGQASVGERLSILRAHACAGLEWRRCIGLAGRRAGTITCLYER